MSLGHVQHDQDTLRSVAHTSDHQHQADAHRQGYEGLDPAVVEELRRRPQMPQPYASLDTGAVSGRSGVHSYLEVIAYGPDDRGTVVELGCHPAKVEESIREANNATNMAGATVCARVNDEGSVAQSDDYEGLDPVQVEEFRQRSRRPRVYAALTQSSDKQVMRL